MRSLGPSRRGPAALDADVVPQDAAVALAVRMHTVDVHALKLPAPGVDVATPPTHPFVEDLVGRGLERG